MVQRHVHQLIHKHLDDHKIIVLLGARQVGKTTLLDSYIDNQTLVLNGDDFDTRITLKNTNADRLAQLIGSNKKLIIDEAQRIENVGVTLKIIHDQLPHVKVIATGSSSFDLANEINEPLTGRKWEFKLWPLSIGELADFHTNLKERRLLEQRLIYGLYPEVVNNPGNEEEILKHLADSYLYKDILTWEDIKKPQKLEALVQALAFQVGQQVSYHELGQLVGLNHETVEKYISLLEKAFIIFRLAPLSRNLRNELKKSRKIYFYDVGIRNAVIKNFAPVQLRQDIGQLWENFMIVERMKHKSNHQIFTNDYFWRTHAQQEVDFIEERNGTMNATEFKWNPKKKSSISKTFLAAYPNHILRTVNPENYESFVFYK